MKNLILCTRQDGIALPQDDAPVLAVGEMQIGKCRGCMRCKILKSCISYNDDAQLCLPRILEADHLEIYLQPGDGVKRLMDRILYALDGKGKTFTIKGDDKSEADYLRRLLTWAGYSELK